MVAQAQHDDDFAPMLKRTFSNLSGKHVFVHHPCPSLGQATSLLGLWSTRFAQVYAPSHPGACSSYFLAERDENPDNIALRRSSPPNGVEDMGERVRLWS